jgi:HAE1 family hydrophobic/amphiphilic exporter-1
VRFNLEFAPGTDIDARKAEIRERLDRIRPTLPDTISRISLDSWGRSDDAVVELRVASATGLTRDYELLERFIVRPIERIPGVSRVELEGATPRELEVALDLEAVQRAGADLTQIAGSCARPGRGARSGCCARTTINPGVRSPAVPADPEAFAALPIPRRGVTPLAAGTGSNGQATSAATSARGPPPAVAGGAGPAVAAAPSLANAGLRPLSSLSVTGAPTKRATSASPGTGQGGARLGEVADVEIHARENRNFRSLDGQLGVDLDVFAEAGASPVEVAAAVHAVVEDLQAQPAGRRPAGDRVRGSGRDNS